MKDEVVESVGEGFEISGAPVNRLDVLLNENPAFANLLEEAKFWSKARNIPLAYQNHPEDCYVAVDMAHRMGVHPLMVMQNLYIIQGKPSWSGQAVTAMLRNNKEFKDVELNWVGKEGDDTFGAFVTATRTTTGKQLRGQTVTVALAKKEGWYQKAGSKWQTMPAIMISYRANAFFGRMYAPELMMGLQTMEEVMDVSEPLLVEAGVLNPYEKAVK